MSILFEIALPVLFVVSVWWASTGVIFYLNSLREASYPWSVLGAAIASLVALMIFSASLDGGRTIDIGLAFLSAIALWGFVEMTFLMGFVTGPRRTPCPPGAVGGQRFRYAFEAIAYHEIALLAMLIGLLWVSRGAVNTVAAGTFGILWLMRLSTKLNIFFGVPNAGADLLPARISYLKSYFRQAPASRFFLPAVTVAMAGTVWLAQHAFVAPAGGVDRTAYTMLATLAALGVIEHWFLVLAIPTNTLWAWAGAMPVAPDPGESKNPSDERASGAGTPIEFRIQNPLPPNSTVCATGPQS